MRPFPPKTGGHRETIHGFDRLCRQLVHVSRERAVHRSRQKHQHGILVRVHVDNFPKCPVPVLLSCRTYRDVRYRYWCHTILTELSGTGNDVVPKLPTFTVPILMSYRSYQSLRCRYWCRTELSQVSGTGIDAVPNLPKYPVPVMPAVYTARTPRVLLVVSLKYPVPKIVFEAFVDPHLCRLFMFIWSRVLLVVCPHYPCRVAMCVWFSDLAYY